MQCLLSWQGPHDARSSTSECGSGSGVPAIPAHTARIQLLPHWPDPARTCGRMKARLDATASAMPTYTCCSCKAEGRGSRTAAGLHAGTTPSRQKSAAPHDHVVVHTVFGNTKAAMRYKSLAICATSQRAVHSGLLVDPPTGGQVKGHRVLFCLFVHAPTNKTAIKTRQKYTPAGGWPRGERPPCPRSHSTR